jgi:hypothetical protein|tara:strand:- start:210 stop:431 length:222 start_codon:yes stop_codon:yes gene_type:complete
MLKTITTIAILCSLAACANKTISKDMLNKDLLDQAQPLYKSCLADYKKTMSDEEAKKACTEKLKNSYKKITEA